MSKRMQRNAFGRRLLAAAVAALLGLAFAPQARAGQERAGQEKDQMFSFWIGWFGGDAEKQQCPANKCPRTAVCPACPQTAVCPACPQTAVCPHPCAPASCPAKVGTRACQGECCPNCVCPRPCDPVACPPAAYAPKLRVVCPALRPTQSADYPVSSGPVDLHVRLASVLKEVHQRSLSNAQETQRLLQEQQHTIQELNQKMEVLLREIQGLQSQVQMLRSQGPVFVPLPNPTPWSNPYPNPYPYPPYPNYPYYNNPPMPVLTPMGPPAAHYAPLSPYSAPAVPLPPPPTAVTPASMGYGYSVPATWYAPVPAPGFDLRNSTPTYPVAIPAPMPSSGAPVNVPVSWSVVPVSAGTAPVATPLQSFSQECRSNAEEGVERCTPRY